MAGFVRNRLLALLGLLCTGGVRAQIRVLSPAGLVDRFPSTRGRIDGSTATFGAPFYGERLLGQLVYGESKLGHAHCSKEDYDIPPPPQQESGEENQKALLNIVIVRRGQCSFVTKVTVAQHKGAQAVIIVDAEDSALTASDIRRIIVADDGYGNLVRIPSILISRFEGQYLIDAAAREAGQVIVELAWDVPTDHIVLVDMWMSSGSSESQRFLREFSQRRKALNDAIQFVPHYHVFGMKEYKETSDLCDDDSGSYCAEDPDGPGYVTGKMVLDEDVRQLCIHDIYKKKPWHVADVTKLGQSGNTVEYAKEFWDYVESLDECPIDGQTELHRFGKPCFERLMRKVGIDADKVEDCARAKRYDKLNEQRKNTAWSPRALRVNGWRYSGTLDADLVTRAICAGFTQQPPACQQLAEPARFGQEEQDYENLPHSAGVGMGTFLTSLLALSCISLFALMLYKRSLTKHIHSALREEVMLEVQAQMDSYKQLDS